MHFNHQYYFKSFVLPPTAEMLWDVYFVGSDSGRAEEIMRVYNLCRMVGLKTKFQVVFPKKKDFFPKELISDFLPYEEIRKNIATSAAILEIVRDGQQGPTLRTMEALFFGKKLITNNPYIVNEEFYHERNIFVLGKRPDTELGDFMKEPFENYDEKYIEQYDLEAWMGRFLEDGNR